MSKRTMRHVVDPYERYEFQVLNRYKEGEQICPEDMPILRQYARVGFVTFGLGAKAEASLTKEGLWYLSRMGGDAI